MGPAIRRAPRLATLDGARIGFVCNKKTNNEVLMDALVAALRESTTLAATHKWKKSSVYAALPKRAMNEVLERCDALVAGPGD